MKGRNFKAMVCAMYFIASKKLNMSKSFKDIALMFNIPEAKIKKGSLGKQVNYFLVWLMVK